MIRNDEEYLFAMIELIGYAYTDNQTLEDLLEEISGHWYKMLEDIRRRELARKGDRQRATRKKNEIQDKQSAE